MPDLSAVACATSVATPRLLLADLQLLLVRNVPDMSAVTCVTSVDDT